MALTWIKSQPNLKDHPKLHSLCESLKINQAQAIGHLHAFWWWCLHYAITGKVLNSELSTVARAALWDRDAKTFISAMVECHFLDELQDGSGYLVHNWQLYSGVAAKFVRTKSDVKVKAGKMRAESAQRGKAGRFLSDTQLPKTAKIHGDYAGVLLENASPAENQQNRALSSNRPAPAGPAQSPAGRLLVDPSPAEIQQISPDHQHNPAHTSRDKDIDKDKDLKDKRQQQQQNIKDAVAAEIKEVKGTQKTAQTIRDLTPTVDASDSEDLEQIIYDRIGWQPAKRLSRMDWDKVLMLKARHGKEKFYKALDQLSGGVNNVPAYLTAVLEPEAQIAKEREKSTQRIQELLRAKGMDMGANGGKTNEKYRCRKCEQIHSPNASCPE